MKNIVVIGAGPAGLTAAYELLKRGTGLYHVTVLEETDQIGGISRTVNHNGNRMDIGGHRFFSKDPAVNEWWNQMIPAQGKPSADDLITGREFEMNPDGPDPETGDEVMLKRRRVSRIYYHHKFFDYPISINGNTIRNLGLADLVKAGFAYLASVFHKLPETSLENFYINRFGKKLYAMFFESYTEKLWGRHPRDISADWGAQRVKGLSVAAILKDIARKVFRKKTDHVETSLIEEFSYPKFGPGQLWEMTAEKIKDAGGEILMNARAEKIIMKDHHVTGVEYSLQGERKELSCDILISSMPLRDLVSGLDGAPEDVAAIAKGLPYRDFVTVGLLLNRLELKNTTSMKTMTGLVPDCWIYVQDEGVRMGRIQIFNNWSPYMLKDPEHTVWIGLEYFCREGDAEWNLDEAQWVEKGRGELVAMGVIGEHEAILDAHMEKVKKAYPAYFDTYDQIDRLIAYLNEFDNLYCIGRNGQHRYNNMDHSMVTAFMAVDNILSGRTDKSNIWNVNTEKEYHEQK